MSIIISHKKSYGKDLRTCIVSGAVLSLAKADQAGCWTSRRGAPLAMPTVMRHEQVLYSRIVCLLCDSETLGGKGAQPAGGLCLSETKMRK